MKIRLFHIAFVVFILNNQLFAQETKRTIDREYWRETKKGIRYDPSEAEKGYNDQWWKDQDNDSRRSKEENEFGKYSRERKLKNGKKGTSDGKNTREIIEYEKSEKEREPDEQSSRSDITVPDFIVYVIVGALAVAILFFLYQFYTGTKRGGKKKVQAIVDDDEKNIEHIDLPESELQRLLREILASGDYRMAVRIWFVFIIRKLRELNYINWERKKTNAQYLTEMRTRKERDEFSETIWLFERIWYGKFDLTKEQYAEVEPVFKKLLENLEQHQPESLSHQNNATH